MAPTDADQKRFGRRVAELRKASGMTQEGLAERASLSVVYISGMENGHRNPTLRTLVKVAAGLGCHPSELLTGIVA